MSENKHVSCREHARISITHHMIAGQKRNLTGDELEAYIKRHAATGGDKVIFESELRLALYPRIRKPRGPKPRDLPGQLTMFETAKPKKRKK